ncbi:hypothetical protein BDW42DRAFT_184666 [Aspergillus taichungensis]|uniref:NACHT domain-containing protein n=1 Tax=Aspergillus taichungensis TaxID=482145 RepID=A0A2J5HYS5_9EURO|nr:hypothetical protein BDW42DRAFT_184666 [Aspergillus taichungensis]
MADPLSIASGAVGILSFGIQVTQSLVDFYNSHKNQDTEIGRTLEDLQSIFNILQFMDAAIRNPQTCPEEQELSQHIAKAIERSEDIIIELQDEYAKFQKVTDSGFGNRIRTASRRATYPFRASTLQKLQEDVGEIRENLKFALSALQHKSSITTHEKISRLRLLVERIDVNQTSSKIRDWLKAPDATINHNSARMKRHSKTGLWFINGNTFTAWLNKPNSFIWLHGFAGSGKSILCSTAIQHTLREKQYEQRVGIAFFYFDFSDQNKQDGMGMLRALLLQLSGQLEECAQDLEQLYKAYYSGTPPTEALINYLQRMINRFHHVYVLLDALDESPRYNQRDGVLEAIETIRSWRFPGLHLLVTSRNEIDIRKSLDPACDQDIPMKNTGIDEDIASFVHYQLNNNPAFSKWKGQYDEIISTLTTHAQGVFRYVQLQLDALKRALNRNHLYRYLHSLPRSLDETYERILDSIDKDYVDDIRRILTMLCFSNQSLTVDELIHAHAVDLNEPSHLDSGRFLDIDGLQEICTGLIEIAVYQDYKGIETQLVQIAHFSVQEYLQLDRVTQQKAAIFALNPDDAEAEVAQVCLVYLLNPALSSAKSSDTGLSNFPLAQYAARNWYHHYKASRNQENEIEKLVVRLFKDQSGLFDTWVILHGIIPTRNEKGGSYLYFGEGNISPLYCASYLGLASILQELILTGLDVNIPGGFYHSALQASSYEGHETIVRMLLKEEAKANNRGRSWRSASRLASNESFETEAGTLLEHDAGVDTSDETWYRTAVHLASARGHEAIVEILLAHGADANIHHTGGDTALQAASAAGYEEIVKLLLAHGAEVNVYDGLYGTALQAASASGYEIIVQILLAHGADANTRNGFFGRTPQQKPSVKHQKTSIQLLTDCDPDISVHADVNASHEELGTALQAAASEGHESIVEILLAHGAVDDRHPEPVQEQRETERRQED